MAEKRRAVRKRNKDREKLSLSVHEAGHVVMYFAFGHAIIYATVECVGTLPAHVRVRPFERSPLVRHGEIRTFAERQILTAFAGHIAQMKFHEPRQIWQDLSSSINDFYYWFESRRQGDEIDIKGINSALKLLAGTYGSRTRKNEFDLSDGLNGALLAFLVQRAILLFERPAVWKTVEALAEALYERETLLSYELWEIARLHGLFDDDLFRQFASFHLGDAYPFNDYTPASDD